MNTYNSGAMLVKRRLQDHKDQAEQAVKKGDMKTARECWREMAKDYRQLAPLELNQLEYTRLIKKARELEEKAGKSNSELPQASTGEEIASDETIDAWRFRSTVTFDDIAGMSEVKRSLKYAIGLQLAQQPDGVSVMELPCRILIYGKPGCGKTLLAAACANTLGAVFYNVKIPDLVSKFVGDSSKMIRALYKRAREAADEGLAVVFIDEVDGLIISRDSSHANYEKQVLGTFLAELDGLAEKNTRSSVITIVATNKPDALDEAFMSRMDLKFKIDLPDEQARKEIFRMHIDKRGYALDHSTITYDQLARLTAHQSGREIQSICKAVLLQVLAEENASIPALVDKAQIKNYTLRLRPFNATDFERVMKSSLS